MYSQTITRLYIRSSVHDSAHNFVDIMHEPGRKRKEVTTMIENLRL